MRPVIWECFEPSLGKVVRLGKLCQSPTGEWVYRADRDAGNLVRVLDAWGVSQCVLDRMAELGIELIHYRIKGEPTVLEATRTDVLKYSIPRSFAGRPGATHWHLPRVYWRTIPDYKSAWVTEVEVLLWREPDVKQAAPASTVDTERAERAEPEAVQPRLL